MIDLNWKMNIYEEYGLSFRRNEIGKFLINPSERDIQKIKDLGIKNIEINDSLGIVPYNLRFLEKLDFIEGISIITFKSLDITPIHHLKNLSFLNLTREFNETIDFEKFPDLKFCQLTWNSKVRNLGQLKFIETLILTNYKKADLSDLKGLSSLKKLSIIKSSIASIDGLENFEHLEYLELISLRKLNSLKGLGYFKNLRRLDLESCSIKDLESLKDNVNLELLGIHNGKDIQSLNPLKDLSKLEIIYLSGNTNIVDGDMSPLIGRKDASVGTRKHYSHSAEEIDKINGTERPKQTWDW
jgi:hypothetical protein